MALYAIGDLHLSLGAEKPMDVPNAYRFSIKLTAICYLSIVCCESGS